MMTSEQARARIGSHRFAATHRVAVSVDGRADQELGEELRLVIRRNGDCQGQRHNSKEWGVEFVRLGEVTYFRHRYQRFLRFTEEPGEARRRVERIWGTGRAVLELVQRQLRFESQSNGRVAGRPVVALRLARREHPVGSIGSSRPSRAWRAGLAVIRLEGEARLDRQTGVPLACRISYAVAAEKDGKQVVISGEYQGKTVVLGRDPALSPPRDFVEARPRVREKPLLSRLLKGHRLNPGWFRGGGPRAARRKQLRPPSMGRGAMVAR